MKTSEAGYVNVHGQSIMPPRSPGLVCRRNQRTGLEASASCAHADLQLPAFVEPGDRTAAGQLLRSIAGDHRRTLPASGLHDLW